MENGESEQPQQKPAGEEKGEGRQKFTRQDLGTAGREAMEASALMGITKPSERKRARKDLDIHHIPSGAEPGIEPGELAKTLQEAERKGKPQIGNKMHGEDDPDRYS